MMTYTEMKQELQEARALIPKYLREQGPNPSEEALDRVRSWRIKIAKLEEIIEMREEIEN